MVIHYLFTTCKINGLTDPTVSKGRQRRQVERGSEREGETERERGRAAKNELLNVRVGQRIKKKQEKENSISKTLTDCENTL